MTIVLASCGGSDDSSPQAVAPAASSPASAAAAGVASTCSLPDFRAGVLARINQVRASGANCGVEGVFPAAKAVTWNDRLALAADGHSADMAAKNYFSHTSADGRTLSTRVDATGYAWAGLGENIAAGYPTVESVMTGWINSPGHCANLMNATFGEVGVACVPGNASGTYSSYWTMDLGRPR